MRGRGRGRATGTGSTSERAGSRFNSKYFGEIIAQLDDRKKDIVRDRGFGILLQYDGCSAPKGFIQWISDQLDLNYSNFLVGWKIIPLSTLSAHLFLGLPMEGEDIRQAYSESTKSQFLSAIKESSLPLIKTFGQKLLRDTLCDDDVFWYFMVVALSMFLCANSSTLPSPFYLAPLIDVSKERVMGWNWSKLVYDWIFSSISNYKKKRRSTIGGCRYFLAVCLFSLLPSFILSFVFDLDLILVMLFEMFCRVTILISSTLERVIGYPKVCQGSSIGRGP